MADHEGNSTRPADGSPARGMSRWGDIAVGTVFEAEQASMRVLGLLRRGVAQRGRRLSDGAATGTAGVRRRIGELAERGAAERIRGQARVADGVDTALAALATSPVLGRVVDAQLDRVLRPIVDTVLDNILDLLEREPERIRALVRSQRGAMVDELVSRVRSGAASGDANIDRLTSRVFRQNREPVPPVEPR